MNKLQALTSYLLGRRLVLPEQLDSYIEQVNLDLVWKPGLNGLHLGDMRYRAVISFERFAGNPSRLMALVGTWLASHDQDRSRYDLPAPAFQVDPLDDDLFDVELALEFVEPQYLTEAPDGEFTVFGKTWALAPFDLWIAEEGEVISHGR